MKRFIRIVSGILTVLMIMSLFPISVIATDTQNTYTVQFDLNYNGAHKIPSQTVYEGGTVVQPENVTREGWIFKYWYIKDGNDGIEKYDLTTPVTENLTLYARWDEDITYWGPIWNRNILGAIERGEGTGNTYTVTFTSSDSSVENIPEAQHVEAGKCANEPSEPTKPGHTFLYWCNQYGEYFDFDTPVESDLTLYAYFAQNIYAENDLNDMLSGYDGELNETLDTAFSPITGIDIYYHMNDVGTVYIRDNILSRLEGIVGLIGSPIDIGHTGSGITSANITLYFDNVTRTSIDLSDLAVFRYDVENDTITILDDEILDIGDDSISFSTAKLGVFGVVQKSAWYEAQNKLLPAIRTDSTPYYNVIMAMDTSGSMSGEKIKTSIDVSTKFVDVLANDDYFSLISFADYPTVLFPRAKLVENDGTDNRSAIKYNVLVGLYPTGGTDIDLALQTAVNECINDPKYKNLIVLVSDGQSYVSEETLEAVKNKSAVVVAVGIGSDVDSTLMQQIASTTGGSYIYCEDASDLQDAFLALQSGYIGSSTDTDNDGLPDLVEITGMRDQYGEIWQTDPNLADSDNDGYSDGEEMGEYHDGVHPYFSRLSRPDMFTKKEKLSIVLTLDGDDDPYIQNSHTYVEWEDTNEADRKFTIVSNVDIALYRMVPDIITPIEPDGIPKEYIYEAPASVKATLADIEFTGRGQEDIESIQYKTTITDDGPYSISYTTRAEVTLKKNTTSEDITKTLKSAKWEYNIDGFISYKTNVWDSENRLTIVNKADVIEKAKAIHEENLQLIYNKKHPIGSKSNTMTIDEACRQVAVKMLAATLSDAQENELKNVRIQEIKNQITVQNGSVPDEVIVAFAEAIIESVTGGSLDELKPLKAPYDTTSIDSSFVKQISEAIDGGILNINKNVSVDGENYHLSGFSFSLGGPGVAGCTVNSKTNLTWTLNAADSKDALARFCNTLAQLNTDSWKEFTSSYVTAFFSILNSLPDGDKNIKSKVDAAFDKSEIFLKALVTNDDGELKELLCNSISEQFYKKIRGGILGSGIGAKTIDGLYDFVKNLIPEGNQLISYAKQYKDILEAISELEYAATEGDQLTYTNRLVSVLDALVRALKNVEL